MEGRNFPFTFEVNDPSGNSFIQNPNAPNVDVACVHENYSRSIEDYSTMGYNVDEAARYEEEDRLKREAESLASGKEPGVMVPNSTKAMKTTGDEQEALLVKMQAINEKTKQQAFAQRDGGAENMGEDSEITAANMDFTKPIDDEANTGDVKKELMRFPSPCPGCFNPGEVRMCVATIPFFKEIIIMAYNCETCGHKSTEIKQGGGISEKASKITFNVQCMADISRDVFKSDTCMVIIPEIDL